MFPRRPTSSISASFNISRISAWRGIEEKGREGFIPRNCAKPSTEISFPRKKVSSGQFASTGNIVEYRFEKYRSIIHRLKFFFLLSKIKKKNSLSKKLNLVCKLGKEHNFIINSYFTLLYLHLYFHPIIQCS